MKIMLAPDSFKGSLSSMEVIGILEDAALRVFGKQISFVRLPIADGGEGTLDAILYAAEGEKKEVLVSDPLGRRIKAAYGKCMHDGKCTGIIEMAQASGLPLLTEAERDPLLTSTYGTGELIRAALDDGIRDFILGIGGSATNDGGTGALQALGMHFHEAGGSVLPSGMGGGSLSRIASIDKGPFDPRIAKSRFTVMCDVKNPLTGPSGATFVYGPQKGAGPETLKILEAGMLHYASLLNRTAGRDLAGIPGTGAAGGLGAALAAFFGAVLKPGIDILLDVVNFEQLLEGVDLVVTGEGRMDHQTASYGKAPAGIASRCAARGIPVVAVAGSIGAEPFPFESSGIASIMPAVSRPMALTDALAEAKCLLSDAGERMFRFIKLGSRIKYERIARAGQDREGTS
ncbi:MAG TPA: glycerate kinase [Clostridiales bacterium]|nr:glycerate kinase [Clostridiales bacterium]